MPVTLEQLRQEIGKDRLAEAANALGLSLQPQYEETDPDLEALRNWQPEESVSVAETTSTQKKKSSKSTAAIEKAQAAQQQNKGAMIKATQATTTANIQAAKKQGKQLAQAGDRAMATSYLETRAEGMQNFANSLIDMGSTILEIADETEAALVVEDEDSDFLMAGSGSFSLR